MLFIISWRNIWRNRTRSFVILGAITVGVWSVIFLISLVTGMVNGYVNSSIQNSISHIQVHQPDFMKDKESRFFLPNASRTLATIEEIKGVKAAALRSLTNAMISSGKGARGVQVNGIDPASERKVTSLSEKMVGGDYFNGKKRNPLIISQRLAGKLGVKLRSKVVLTFQDLDGNITAGAFRIVGLFDTSNNIYDESEVFVLRKKLNRLLGGKDIAHEVAVQLEDVVLLDSCKQLIQSAQPELLVQTYKEISPALELFQSQIQMMASIYMVIFMLALIFGIINSMLMAVLERIRELGMIMAIGMNKLKVFLMVVLETIFLSLIASPVGLFLGFLSVQYFKERGLNLFFFSQQGMKQFGMPHIIYPTAESGLYLQLALAVGITAVLASLYPAFKAIGLRPAEAIRKQ